MSWSTDGVQTGTDTDISGIGNVTGVTLTTIGSGSNVRRIANVTVDLDINGTLTLDPEHEEIVFGDVDKGIDVNGTFNIGKKITINSVDRYSFGTAIHHTHSSAWGDTPYLLNVKSGGTLNWYGGVIYTGGKSLMFASGSTVKIYSQNAVFVRTQDSANAEAQVRMETDNFELYGFTDVGYNDTQDWFSFIGFWDVFKGFRPVHKKAALSPSYASSSDMYVAENYDSAGGNTYDNLFWRNRRMRFKNAVKGSVLNLVGLASGNSNNRGVFEVTEDFIVKLLDSSQNNIAGGMIYLKDYDNGDRKNDNVSGNNTNYVDDREYVGTTDSNGDVTIQSILTMVVVRNSGTAVGTPDSGDNKYDYRSKNNDNTDVFDIGIHAYGYVKVVASNMPLKGANGVEYERTLFADLNITESNKSTVSGYTTIDDMSELYDYGSYWHLKDSTGKNIAIPSLGEFLIKGAGDTVDLSDYDVEIDDTASNQFDYDSVTNTLTIKPASSFSTSTKFKKIKTTGDVNIASGVTFSGIAIEAGKVTMNSTEDLANVTITGDLHINTGANSTLSFDNVTVTGNIYNDDTAHTLIIQATNGSSLTAGDPGTGNGETDIQNAVVIKITVKDIDTGNLITNARVFLKEESSGTVLINEVTGSDGSVSTNYNYSTDIDVIGWARQGTTSPYYKQGSIGGTITSAGFSAQVFLIKDE